MTFEEIFSQIKDYQLQMGYDYELMEDKEKISHLRNYTVALMMEQAELLDEVSWKPWRKHADQKPIPNNRKIALEWVDCLFFLVDQAFCLDLTADDILKAFDTKSKANYARITSGYSKTLKRENEGNAK